MSNTTHLHRSRRCSFVRMRDVLTRRHHHLVRNSVLYWGNAAVRCANTSGDVTYVAGFESNRGGRVQGLGSAALMVGVHRH